MEQKKILTYKYCVVPMCQNTTVRTPQKLFFLVPAKEYLRKKWCKLMKRDNFKSETSARYCCEDHFDLEQDVSNYWKYKLMNAAPRLKPGIFPHKFECQEGGKRKSKVPERRALVKRKMLCILEDSEASINVPGPSTSQAEVSKEISEEFSSKAIQVSFKPKCRSIGVNTSIQVINAVVSPLSSTFQSVATFLMNYSRKTLVSESSDTSDNTSTDSEYE